MNQEPSILDFIKERLRNGFQKLFNPSAAVQNSELPGIKSVEQENLAQSHAQEERVDATAQIDGQADQKEASVPVLTGADQKETGAAVVSGADQKVTNTGLFRYWRTLLALGLGVLAQLYLEPHPGTERTWVTGTVLYLLAGLILVWANLKHEWSLQPWIAGNQENSGDRTFLRSTIGFVASLVFSLIAFGSFSSGLFNPFNLVLWFLAILTMAWALWIPGTNARALLNRFRNFVSRPAWNFKIDRWALLVLAAFGLVIFFRTYRLADVPSQMVSDHAEKLLDIGDVLNGKTAVFFPRNTGREFFQFYLTAAIILLFKTGLTFMSLKIGTTLAGLVTVYYIYLLGKEVGNRRVGLLAMVFAGIAYWPNVISRFGLRFPLYPLFYAPALYYLIRGSRLRNRNYFIFSGFFLGLGLNGYSPYRIVPFVVLVAIGLYLLHKQSIGYRRQAVWGLVGLVAISFIIFIPLLRYMIAHPDIVIYRAMTRLGTLERPIPGSGVLIFLQNFWKSLTMFSWSDGEVWPISVPFRPALDAISSALFHLGLVLVVIRYIRQRHWVDIFTLISIPMLMLPSILSLAFPGENPSMNRPAAAIIPVFLIIGLALDGMLKALETVSTSSWNRRFAWVLGVVLLAGAAAQNYDLVFNQYRKLYDESSWNTTEVGQVVHDFSQMVGTSTTQWLVGYPYWVDSRLVMINAGFPMQDDAVMPPNLQDTLSVSGFKQFILDMQDTSSLDTLKSLYPKGWVTEYKSKYPNKDFLIFLVPPQ